MSVPFQPWIIRPDGTLVIEDFCRYGTEDCRFFTVDSVALPTGSSQILFTRYMTCTHCGEIDLISRPMLELPPSGYAVYHVIWKRPPSPDVDGRLRTLEIWMVANSRRMAYEVTFGKWRGITTVPGARCFIDGEEYDNGRPSFAQMLKWRVPRSDVSRLVASRPRWQAWQGKADGGKMAPVIANRGDIILDNGFIRCAPFAITVVKTSSSSATSTTFTGSWLRMNGTLTLTATMWWTSRTVSNCCYYTTSIAPRFMTPHLARRTLCWMFRSMKTSTIFWYARNAPATTFASTTWSGDCAICCWMPNLKSEGGSPAPCDGPFAV